MSLAKPEPLFITKVFSYLAIIAFFGGLAGLATLRWDLRRLYISDVKHLAGADDQSGKERANEVGDRFMPGFVVGCAIGGLVLMGYHFQHGFGGKQSDERR